METAEYDTLNIPTWSLSALINGDFSGLDENDEKLIRDFERNLHAAAIEAGYNNYIIGCPDEGDEAFFTSRPEFGLDCDCFKLKVIFCK